MLIPFGILSAAGAGGEASPTDYELIATTVVSGSVTTTIDFTGLGTYSSTYKHLQVRWTARSGSSLGAINLTFNADSGSNYISHNLRGTSTSVTSGSTSLGSDIGFVNGSTLSTDTANAFTAGILDLLDSYSTTKNKTIRSLYGRDNIVYLRSGLWISTASVTSIKLVTNATNFVAGSRFSIYGIRG